MFREAERTSVGEVAKKHGVSEQPVYAWRKRFGGMEVGDAKRLKALEFDFGARVDAHALTAHRAASCTLTPR